MYTDHCQDGDVRLVGDLSAYKGRVEVCFSQRWGVVRSEGWSARDAQVVCRQLGYPSTGMWLYIRESVDSLCRDGTDTPIVCVH